jgi:hypothetical protein
VSGLDELTREELIALVLKLHETVQAQEMQLAELRATVARQAGRIAELEEEVRRLRGGNASAPLWIRPSVQKKEKAPRKKRRRSFARKNLPPTRLTYHALEHCPDCGRKLAGGSVKWRHQVIELPQVKVEVTDHLFVERRCGVCKKRWTPDPEVVLAGVVVGRKRLGIGLMSVICHLKTVCRVPIDQVQGLLATLYGLRISAGEIAEIGHDVAELGESEYEALLSRIRGSPVLHGDETGWREDGANGYLWSFSSPEVRYYLYRKSRAGAVVTEVLGEDFAGVLVSDFLGSYNIYDGLKQRCWVHLGRDLKELSERNPDMPEVSRWVESVLDVWYRAKEAAKKQLAERERIRLRRGFEQELKCLCKPYLGVQNAPQRVLAERMEWFMGELFTFVEYPEVPSENNAAERAIRPAVVARKISGGTRSERGSNTASVLRSLFETWTLQGRNTIEACREMLARTNTAQSAPVQ